MFPGQHTHDHLLSKLVASERILQTLDWGALEMDIVLQDNLIEHRHHVAGLPLRRFCGPADMQPWRQTGVRWSRQGQVIPILGGASQRLDSRRTILNHLNEASHLLLKGEADLSGG